MNAPDVTVVGNWLSPYVRKVLACLELKGVAYRVDPIVPFFGDDAFSRLSPLRRIPVLIDGERVINDSTVICEYVEERFPGPALLPADPADRAQARFLEEYADSRLGDVFIWKLWNHIVLKPGIWGEKGDRELTARVLAEDVPAILDWLEAQAPAEGFRFGSTPGLADFAPAAFFRNLEPIRLLPDVGRWPRPVGWMGRTLDSPPLQALRRWEEVSMIPIPEQRAALAAAGAPLTETSFAADRPRRGIMPI